MNIAVLGTGTVGRTLAGRIAGLGHDVAIGTRDPEATLARTEPDGMGNPPFSAWHAEHEAIALRPFREAAAGAELVVTALAGAGVLEALRTVGTESLAGKVLLDVSNPLDFSAGFPPTLFVKDSDSLAEQIQRAFPEARVVKSLNTVTAAVMVDPAAVADADHTIFVSGDDARAKAAVAGLLERFGWRDIVDLGDLTTARGAEMWLPLWLRIMSAVGTPMFNVKVVR